MKDYPETHQKGYLSVEQSLTKTNIQKCDFGIQITKDGRIWICIDGMAFLRFKPITQPKQKGKVNHGNNKTSFDEKRWTN